MGVTIGIRREDKSLWERRVPLVPEDVAALARHGIRFLVQSSAIRVFSDEDYRALGIDVVDDLDAADMVLAVKEIPSGLLVRDKVYVFFAHVTKGQPHNMEMLARLLELRCSLVDYEKIVDARGVRLIFFGRHAGHAGMIETLWALGQRLSADGANTPFSLVRHAHEYESLASAKAHIAEIGAKLAGGERPLVFGVAGYGNVSRGAQEILDCLPHREVAVDGLPAAANERGGEPIVKVVFAEEHMVRPKDAGARFDLRDYYDHPERYEGTFAEHLPHLDVLVNTIYWDERYPRLVTKEWVGAQFDGRRAPRLRVVGDISCDIEGSVEITLKATNPDEPCFVYDPRTGTARTGTAGEGIVVMAVDNLPCELPREASEHFSAALVDMVPALVAADWRADLDALVLPPHLRNAVIVHKGELTPAYSHIAEFLGARPRDRRSSATSKGERR